MALGVFSDEHFMKEALKEAHKAYALDEVPIGAVVVYQQQVIARAHNYTEHLTDVTAHAEMQAFTAAADYLGGKYLEECTLYVTIEPCVMCAGAAFWTQIPRIVFGARDEKRGYLNMGGEQLVHPKSKVKGGVMADDCSELLQLFFKEKR